MPYKKPKQARAIESEKKFLMALDELLREKSFEETSIEEIAGRSSQTKAAFLQRFGSKDQALFLLFERYAGEASALMSKITAAVTPQVPLKDCMYKTSYQFDELLQRHFSANRAMNEYFKKQLDSHELTKKIFVECIQMMQRIQQTHGIHIETDISARSAAQLLVTLNFDYAMKAMRAFPAEPETRHELIADILALALQK